MYTVCVIILHCNIHCVYYRIVSAFRSNRTVSILTVLFHTLFLYMLQHKTNCVILNRQDPMVFLSQKCSHTHSFFGLLRILFARRVYANQIFICKKKNYYHRLFVSLSLSKYYYLSLIIQCPSFRHQRQCPEPWLHRVHTVHCTH